MKKTIVWIILLCLLAVSVTAASKPIVGKVIGGSGSVDLFVEVQFLGKSEVCVVNPITKTGPEGDFATNLGNLVFKDFPEVRCDSSWKIGDKIWYQFDGHSSAIETIGSGTGLQILSELNLIPADSTPPSSGGGGSSGRETTTKQETKTPEVQVNLKTTAEKTAVRATLILRLLNNIPSDLELKLVLSDTANNFEMKTISDQISLKDYFGNQYYFDCSDLTPGQYQIRAFVYYQDSLLVVSDAQKFLISDQPLELELEAPQPVSSWRFESPVTQIILIILLVAVICFLIYKVTKIKTKNGFLKP